MRVLTTALLCGCSIEPFETPSAYDAQRYLCDDLDLLDEEADACLEMPAEENCTGVISFQGQVQRVPIRVDTTLQRSLVHVAENTDGQQFLSRVEISGAAPYFHFDVAISSLGTDWPQHPTGTHDALTFETPNPETALELDDAFGAVQWYIRAGTDTATLPSNSDPGGVILVTYLSDERVELRFAGGLGPADDTLSACVIAFPQSVDIVFIQ